MTLTVITLLCLGIILCAHSVFGRAFDRRLDRALWNLEDWKGLGAIPRGLTRRRNLSDANHEQRAERRRQQNGG